MDREPSSPPHGRSPASGEYVVVARRYRPQAFDELIGQEHVARALVNAIAGNRVGHAYLFTGARGVGKTSAARILAKALDCEKGSSSQPCGQCDICQSIAAGSDMDVLEIDGASNRGIDEIRQLRQNVGVRPSRARFKIYIIDEVHMLTKEAFNALLKTLEEPPEHVKFIFCTTEAAKIPITILSRCQRFDFAGIRTPQIVERLRQIAELEGVPAEREALELLARRANGSMRDSQSLLEQLLAFGGQQITVADVHALLGTADDARLERLVRNIAGREPGAALAELDAALAEAVDVGQLLEQLLGWLRDAMLAAVGCPAENFLYTSSGAAASIASAARSLGLETVLAAMQMLDQTLARLRYSTQGRILAELALVRLCSLENLDELAALVSQVREQSLGTAAASGVKKNTELRPAVAAEQAARVAERPAAGVEPTRTNGAATGEPHSSAEILPTQVSSEPGVELSAESLPGIWQAVLGSLGDLLADHAALASIALEETAASTATGAPKRLVLSFGGNYNSCKTFCERPEQRSRLEQALATAAGQPVGLVFRLAPDGAGVANRADPPARPAISQRQRMTAAADHPLVRRSVELFGGTIVRVDGDEKE